MQFKKYLNEQKAEEIYEIIKKDCKPYLNLLKSINFNNYLYSGRRIPEYVFTKKKIRKGRKPKDTPQEIHEWLDNWFYKKFGIKARSNTLFCTSDFGFASNYGIVHYVFPIGKFEMIWSYKHKDIYNRAYMDRGLERYIEYFEDNFADTYIKGNERKALGTGHEIMLSCKEYYLMYMIDDESDKVIDMLEFGNEV